MTSLTFGAGRALKAGFLVGASSSFFIRASFAALSFAAMASPGSLKVGRAAGFDFGGLGGVGKESEIGLGFE